jgi:hypothetical protein
MTTVHDETFTVTVADGYGAASSQELNLVVLDWIVDTIEPANTLAYNATPVEVVMYGWGLRQVEYVLFGEWEADILWLNDTELHVQAPIGPVCSVDIFVNGEPVGRFAYTELPPPDPEPPGPGGVPMHQGRCLALARMSAGLEVSDILDLMDDELNGIIVDSVDLGWPDVRESAGVWTDADGGWDFTRFFGARGVSLGGTLVTSARGSRMQAYRALVPYLAPSARPVLIFCLNADQEVHYLRLRGASYSGAVTNPLFTTWQGQWRAPEALAYSMLPQSATVLPVEHTDVGRIYAEPQPDETEPTDPDAWVPDRKYPAMTGAVSANASNEGSAPTWPTFEIHGDCTGPVIVNDTTGQTFAMKPGFRVHHGETLTVDTRHRAVYLGADPGSTRYGQVDFTRSTWWPLVPGPNSIRFDPAAAEETSSLDITWQNAHL